MDCEKFEPLLLDELYEELDELTSAAVKRHVSGCARCASILGDMSATRRAVSLPLVPAPAGLEDRILAAAKEAQKVVPIKSRMSRALSIAGSWAMRPQTAMAAVFLLMIGTSAFVIRSRNYESASKDASVSVTVAGAPAPTVATPQSESLDDKAAAAAHGPTPPNVTRPPAAAPAAAAVALAESEGNGVLDSVASGAAQGKSKADESGSLASAFGDPNVSKDSHGYAPPPPGATAAAVPAPVIANAAAPAGAPNDYAQAPVAAYAGKRAGPTGQDPFSLGAAAFRARNFAEAARQYDIAAQSGDPTAALWAAESVREGQGCATALGRFDQLSQKAAGSWPGNEAALRAARCEIAMGQLDAAKGRLDRLAHEATHQQAAQQALADLKQVASRKGGGSAPAGGAAAPRRTHAAPRRAAEAEEQKKAQDTSTGY